MIRKTWISYLTLAVLTLAVAVPSFAAQDAQSSPAATTTPDASHMTKAEKRAAKKQAKADANAANATANPAAPAASSEPAPAADTSQMTKAQKRAAKKQAKADAKANEANAAPASTPAASPAETPAPAPAPGNTMAKSAAPAAVAPPPSGSGKVWVNTATGVYHMEGDKYYGKTKEGKYMTVDEANQAGYHAAKKGGHKKQQ